MTVPLALIILKFSRLVFGNPQNNAGCRRHGYRHYLYRNVSVEHRIDLDNRRDQRDLFDVYNEDSGPEFQAHVQVTYGKDTIKDFFVIGDENRLRRTLVFHLLTLDYDQCLT